MNSMLALTNILLSRPRSMFRSRQGNIHWQEQKARILSRRHRDRHGTRNRWRSRASIERVSLPPPPNTQLLPLNSS